VSGDGGTPARYCGGWHIASLNDTSLVVSPFALMVKWTVNVKSWSGVLPWPINYSCVSVVRVKGPAPVASILVAVTLLKRYWAPESRPTPLARAWTKVEMCTPPCASVFTSVLVVIVPVMSMFSPEQELCTAWVIGCVTESAHAGVDARPTTAAREAANHAFACIGNSNAILPMTTVAGVPPFQSGRTHA